MNVIILFLFILSSGGIFSAAYFKKRFEEALPVYTLGNIFIIYVFGLFGFLKQGVYFLVGFSALLYVVSLISILLYRKNLKNHMMGWIGRIFTPGFFFFWITAIVLAFMLKGLLASGWDEFSHWMYIVKIMTMFDMYGTTDCLNAWNSYPSYPPGMAIFQYVVEKIYLFFYHEEIFCEWITFWAYYVLFIAASLPLYSGLKLFGEKGKEVLKAVILSVVILFIPLNFFSNLYHSVYIDPFLGLLVGFCMANIVTKKKEEKDLFYSLYVWFSIASMILAKDVGYMFGTFTAVLFILDYFAREGIKNWNVKKIVMTVITILSVVIPKVSWRLKLKLSETMVRWETHIDFKVLWNVITGKDDSYRTEVYRNYNKAMFERTISLGNTNIQINSFLLVIILALSLYLVLRYLYRKEAITKAQRTIYFAVVTGQLVLYVIGMCVVYMFNFYDYEAVALASCDRYLNIVFLATTLVLVFLFVKAWDISVLEKGRSRVGLLLLLLVLSPLSIILAEFQKESIDKAVQDRTLFMTLSDKIARHTTADDFVHIVAQGCGDQQSPIINIMKFASRPGKICASYSIGVPFFEGDVWTLPVPVEQWQEEYLSGIEYVGILVPNQYFCDNYASAFADPSTIVQNGLYRVNHEDGLLYLVE